MTQLERMCGELPYRPLDKELTALRRSAQKMCRDYNELAFEGDDKRSEVLHRLFKKIGNGGLIEPPFHCDYGFQIEIGENFYANYNCVILDTAKVTIGDNVMIGPNVGIYTAGHPLHAARRNSGEEFGISVKIGSNVWIGGNAVILPGVTIGDNTVIGAGSVVTKDIPANVAAAGNPCRVLREITEQDADFYFKDRRFE